MIAFVYEASAQPYGMTARPMVGRFLNDKLPPGPPRISTAWSTEVAFPGLTFSFPLGLVPMPGTGDLVVWEREGRVWAFANDPAATTRRPVLDITNRCQGWMECGLLGLAFHPGFATNRFMFVYYNWVPLGTVVGGPDDTPFHLNFETRNRLSRFTLDANGVAIDGSEQVLIDQRRHSLVKNGGGLFFHPGDGFLYLSVGDDSSATVVLSQRLDLGLFTGIVRIDVDQRGGGISHPISRQPREGFTTNYFIPNSNPFVGLPDALEEYFALGLRNPHRMTLDPPTGRIFIGDVGAESREEINVIEPGESGLNFQWNDLEGGGGDLTPPYAGLNRRPFLDYPHSEGVGKSVIGGYVYRGSRFAGELGGKYIFGDNISRYIWMLNEDTAPPTKTLLAVMPRGPGPVAGNDYTGISSFGIDQNGEIYICQLSTIGSQIYRLKRDSTVTGPDMPSRLSETGAFSNLATLVPAPGLVPYDVTSPLWSDASVKSRWMAIPSPAHIEFSTNGEWRFPEGSVFVKHFELGIDDQNPATRRRLETRILVRDTNGYVYGGTYKWRSDQSDADLLVSGLTEPIAIATAFGTRTQTWTYPSRQDCLSCHTGPAGGVLGIKTRQSNRDFHYDATGLTDNQLRAWNHIGLFSPALVESQITGYPHLVNVTNASASLDFRVRSYLDANCSHCHRPGGVRSSWDARFDTPLEQQGIVNGPVVDTLNIVGARVIIPGDLSRSLLHHRLGSLGVIKMPPLAKNVLDAPAIATVTEWINSLANWNLQAERNPSGVVRLWFDAVANQTFVIEASPDLNAWTPLSTNTPIAGRVEHIEPSPVPGRRFFRVRAQTTNP